MPSFPITFDLSVRGAAFLDQKFKENDAKLVRGLQKVVYKYGEDTKKLAKSLSPVLTGYMRSMIKTEYSEDGFIFECGWNLGDDFLGTGRNPYPFYQEFGTRFHKAQPSINPAFQEMAPKFTAACGGYVALWAASEIQP